MIKGSSKLDKVSIIIPMYNSEKYITDCINSVLNQTYKNIEVIIINDGSTDQSLSLCQEFAIKDSRVNLINIKNSGVSAARNIGIENSTGDFITFVDSDDWIKENMIELAIEKIKEKKADVVMWSFYRNFPNKQVNSSFLPFKEKVFNENKDHLFLGSIHARFGKVTESSGASIGTVWCKLYKAEIIKENNLLFNPTLTRAQDVIFSMKALNSAEKIYYFDERLYHYRISNTSTTSGNKFIEDTNKPFDSLLAEFENFINENDFSGNKNFYNALHARAIQVLMWHLDHYYFHDQYPNKLRMMRKQIKELINKEPYKTAIEKVDRKVLPKKERLMVALFKKRLILLFYFIYSINSKRKRTEKY